MIEDYGPMKNPIPYLLANSKEFKKTYDDMKKKGFYVHSMARIPKEWEKLSEAARQDRLSYYTFCSMDEVERILVPKTQEDYLLSLQAKSIETNMRILRTIHHRARNVKENEWTLSQQFEKQHITLFKQYIDSKYSYVVNSIVCGSLFSDDPNAYCTLTSFGNLVVFSEGLKQFLYFLNLSFYDFWNPEGRKIPSLVKRDALIIGIRTMLMSESFDFELDPRGKIPKFINNRLQEVVSFEILFVLAHEYGHIILGHLDPSTIVSKKPFLLGEQNPELPPFAYSFYNRSQIQEFQADAMAIDIIAGTDPQKRKSYLFSALFLFCYFELYEGIYCELTGNHLGQNTHPPAPKRREKIVEMGNSLWSDDDLETIEAAIHHTKHYKQSILDLLTSDPDKFTFYGSLYLSPWRLKKKIDRVDY